MCENFENDDVSRRKSKFNGPKTGLVLTSLRSKGMMGVR